MIEIKINELQIIKHFSDISEAVQNFWLQLWNQIFDCIISNIVTDKMNAMHVFILCTLITKMLTVAWIWIHNVNRIIFFCILYDFFSDIIVLFLFFMLILLFSDLTMMRIRMSMCFSFADFDLLIKFSIAEIILNSDLRFSEFQIFSDVLTLTDFVFINLAFCMHRHSQESNVINHSEQKRNYINTIFRIRKITEIVKKRKIQKTLIIFFSMSILNN